MSRCPAEVAPTQQPARRRWRDDYVGHAFVGGGVAGIVLGSVLVAKSASDADAAPMGATDDDWQRLRDRAVVLRVTGIASVLVGVGAAAYGVYHYQRFGKEQVGPRVSGWVAPTSAGIAVTVSWP
jgi:hypothetical protein